MFPPFARTTKGIRSDTHRINGDEMLRKMSVAHPDDATVFTKLSGVKRLGFRSLRGVCKNITSSLELAVTMSER